MQLDIKSIEDITSLFLEHYKKNLEYDGKRATGELIDQSSYIVEFDGRYLTVSLDLPEQWKYVEYGRKPGKFPPVDAIRKWIRVKSILPRPINGKVPTENQLAFLIGRKIARDGIPAGNYLKDTLVDFDLTTKVYDAIEEQLQRTISAEVKSVFD